MWLVVVLLTTVLKPTVDATLDSCVGTFCIQVMFVTGGQALCDVHGRFIQNVDRLHSN